MGNLMTSMWTAVSGLTTSQNGLNTTAHNMANVNTEGYTRQMNINTDLMYNTVGTASGQKQVGLGSMTAYVRQLRNEFYDTSYRTEYSREGFYEAQYNVASEIEDLFGEMEGVSFQNQISEIWTAMEEMAKEPETLTSRSTFVNSVSNFIDRAQDIYGQLVTYQKDINTSIETTVNKINELGQQIYNLNKNITKVEAAGVERANDLRDQRNQCLDDLSNLISIDYYEDQFGGVHVSAEGSFFVSDINVTKMSTRTANDASGFLIPYWSDTADDVYSTDKFVEITDYTDTGYLKGLVMARGTSVSTYADVPSQPKQPEYPLRSDYVTTDDKGTSTFDQTGFDAAVAKFNTDNDNYKIEMNRFETSVAEYNKKVDVSSIMSVMSEFDQLVNGIVSRINNILSPNKEIDVKNADGTITKMTVLDEENAPLGMDEDHSQGIELIKRKYCDRYTEMTVDVATTDDAGNTIVTPTKVKKYNEEEYNNKKTMYTLGQLEINADIKENYSILPLSEKNGSGGFSYSGVVVDLIGIWDENFKPINPNTLSVFNFQDYYTAMIGDLGNTGNNLNTMRESQNTLVSEIEAKRQGFTGVSSDEELSNMVKYQHAYNAASRYFEVINQMLDTLVNGLG